MKELVPVLIASAALAGCGVVTVERTYDDNLIREIGVGSNAVGELVPTLE